MTDPDLYQRAGALFDELVGLGDEARARALAAAAQDDPPAADLAGKMLRHDRQDGIFGLGDAAAEPAAMLGAVVDGYELESFLGRGGMGAVYVGRRRHPDARVAIKFITLSRAPAEALERFRRETEVLAALDHPGIVGYRSSGVDSAGRPYLIMDLVEGEALQPSAAAVTDNVDATVAIAIALAEAVHHFHQRGVVHRDLKPSNVLLAPQPDGGWAPIVIDFGIARSFAPSADAELTGTIGFGPVGTPAYMAPELRSVDGAPATPDVRSDVYSLGAVLCELLSGEPTPKQLPNRDLDAIVRKALATLPVDRYGSAEAFGADLRRWREGRPIVARKIGLFGRLKRLARRRPLETLSVAAATVALVATSIVTSLSLAKERRTRHELTASVQLNGAINNFLFDDIIARVVPTFDGPDVRLLSVLERAFESRAPRTDSASRVIGLNVGLTLYKVYRLLGRTEDAATTFERIVSIAADVDPNNSARLQFDLLRGSNAGGRGDFADLQTISEDVWRRLETPTDRIRAADAKLRTLRASAAQQVATAREAQGDLEGATRWLQRATDQQPENPRVRISLLQTRAFIEQKLGTTDRAIATMLAAIDAAKDDPKSQIYVPVFTTNIAHWLNQGAEFERAVPHAERAVAIGTEVYADPTHPYHLTALENLSTAYAGCGRLDEAIARRREALRGTESRFGAASTEAAIARIDLASQLQRAEGHDAEALRLVVSAAELLAASGTDQAEALAAANRLRKTIEKELRASSR